jgi:hypothetical protein
MNVKIQGGGNGTYANSGSCFGVVSYLRHEDAELLELGKPVEKFFSYREDSVTGREVTERIDNNKQKLCREDAKFFIITVSPSAAELRLMGSTPQERAEAFKGYIRDEVMKNYASGFDKGLSAGDIMYYGKIHYERERGGEMDMHAHIIVSRKDVAGRKKLSPMTNHRGTGRTGSVKGGFDRSNFFRKCEQSFDVAFDHNRDIRDSYDYQNAIKNGTIQEKREAVKKSVEKEKTLQAEQKQQQQQSWERSRGISM